MIDMVGCTRCRPAVLVRAYPLEFFELPEIPAALQQTIARPLAVLARRRGLSTDPAGLDELAPRAVARTSA